MRKFISSKAWPAGLALLIVLSTSVVYGLRKEAYLLNRNTRIVSMRILKFKELSLHRGYSYRIRFDQRNYLVQALAPGPGKDWHGVQACPYEDSVESASPGSTIVFRHGELISFHAGEEREKPMSYLIVYFFHPKEPSLRKGIIFYQSGAWRAL